MAGHIKINVEKLEVQVINTKINSKIFEEFQKKLKQQNISMNVVIETFARQYANGRYDLNEEDILKWKDDNGEVSILNTPINKDVYYQFKYKVKAGGYFVRHILSAFIEDYGKSEIVLELIKGKTQTALRE